MNRSFFNPECSFIYTSGVIIYVVIFLVSIAQLKLIFVLPQLLMWLFGVNIHRRCADISIGVVNMRFVVADMKFLIVDMIIIVIVNMMFSVVVITIKHDDISLETVDIMITVPKYSSQP